MRNGKGTFYYSDTYPKGTFIIGEWKDDICKNGENFFQMEFTLRKMIVKDTLERYTRIIGTIIYFPNGDHLYVESDNEEKSVFEGRLTSTYGIQSHAKFNYKTAELILEMLPNEEKSSKKQFE